MQPLSGSDIQMVAPLSTTSSWPVTALESSQAKKRMAAACSSGVAQGRDPSKCLAHTRANSRSKPAVLSLSKMPVLVGPGQTAFQRMPVPAYWMATFLVMPSTAALAAV